ncbi:MAG: ABC transporter permease [Deltaproteobacteria bacterium]|nr:ABC transporter permease [Deltaproteobacteria bacterium]
MLVQLAWRNLWRNKRRTIITLSALALGVTGIVSLQGYRESAFAQMLESITTQLVGHIQIHGRGYQEAPDIGNVVADPVTVEAVVRGVLPGVRPERRVLGAGLVGTEDTAAGALVMGVQAGQGSFTVTKGQSLTHAASAQPAGALLGVDLAAQLGVEVGGEVVLIGQAKDGSVANDRYLVVGLADAGTHELNATAVFLLLEDAQSFFGLGDGVHQLVLRLPTDDEDLSSPLAATRGALDLKALEALSWNEMLPELKNTIEIKRQGQHSIDVIVFLIVGLGVLNIMTMSVFERTREIGVMLALGTRPRRVLALIVTESMLQGVLGLAIGLALAAAILYGFGSVDLGGLASGDVMGIRFPTRVELRMPLSAAISAGVTIIVTMLVGGLLPALRAARLVPVEAMRSR